MAETNNQTGRQGRHEVEVMVNDTNPKGEIGELKRNAHPWQGQEVQGGKCSVVPQEVDPRG